MRLGIIFDRNSYLLKISIPNSPKRDPTIIVDKECIDAVIITARLVKDLLQFCVLEIDIIGNQWLGTKV